MKTFIILIFALLSIQTMADLYKEHFKEAVSADITTISDPISDKPINTTLSIIKDSNQKVLGYVREVTTTTGCDSACLPVIFTLIYNEKKMLIHLKSKPGLTKKFHARFTTKDYEKLDLILALNPDIFKKVSHPTQMVDAISGATKSEFVDSVVKDAAYTSLRVNTYNQQTLEFLKTL